MDIPTNLLIIQGKAALKTPQANPNFIEAKIFSVQLDKTNWTENILASIKFGFACGVFNAAFPWIIRRLVGISIVNPKGYVVSRVSDGLVTTILFSVIYYLFLILFDLYFEERPKQ